MEWNDNKMELKKKKKVGESTGSLALFSYSRKKNTANWSLKRTMVCLGLKTVMSVRCFFL